MNQADLLQEKILLNALNRCSNIAKSLCKIEELFENNTKFKGIFFKLVQLINVNCQTSSNDKKNSVHFCALGKSGDVAKLVVSMFRSVSISANFLHPTEAFHGDFGAIRHGDICICISNSGESHELLDVVSHLKDKNCPIFCITSRADSQLAKSTDNALLLPKIDENCPLQQAPITSTILTLTVCQLLVAATMEYRGFDLINYAKNHPGGLIGRRITLKVEDLMVKQSSLPLVKVSEPFPNCVSLMTKYGFGAVLVANEEDFLGLIAERDLRFSMEKWQAEVFNKTACDFMNANPIVVTPELMAIDALRIMEDRPHPLSILPVVDINRKIVGLLRIHDLVAAGLSL